jgi:hypothetical protein
MNQIITRLQGNVVAQARANVREGSPSIRARINRQLDAGAEYPVVGITNGDAVAGQDDWYVGADGTFVWGGAVRLRDGAFVSADGFRREDGTLKALPTDRIREIYGTFAYTEVKGGAIKPDPAWARTNIRKFRIENALDGRGMDLWVHVKAAPHFERAFAEIEAAGLLDRILTYDGSYVPRHMGWNPTRALSSHSWGVAVDFNTRWNGYGAEPAAMGALGSLREIVPFFERAGFAWGGRFAPASLRDGMHFELAVTNPMSTAPIVVTPGTVTPATGSAAQINVMEEVIDGLRSWTFLDPRTGLKRQAGKIVSYSLADPATKALIKTRGLSRYGGFPEEPAPKYSAQDWRPAFGYWADLIEPTAEGESRRHFTCVNSYDRAAFTFGCFQFAAHTPERNLIRLFRALLKIPDEAVTYFPELSLVQDRVHLLQGGQTISLEGPAQRADKLARLDAKGVPVEQGRFMDYLNGSLVSAERDEALAAARLITWATHSPAHRQAQVVEGIWHAELLLRDTHQRLSKLGATLQGAPISLCAMIFDIRHQGRSHPAHKTAIAGLAAALSSADPMDMLCEFSAEAHGPRIETVRQKIESGLSASSFAPLRYDASLAAFV